MSDLASPRVDRAVPHLLWRLRKNDTAKHLCGLAADELEKSEQRVADLLEALRKIAAPQSCGCVPCRGQCRSQEALQATLDAIRDEADAAIAKAEA